MYPRMSRIVLRASNKDISERDKPHNRELGFFHNIEVAKGWGLCLICETRAYTLSRFGWEPVGAVEVQIFGTFSKSG
jgi:hypothetical protein